MSNESNSIIVHLIIASGYGPMNGRIAYITTYSHQRQANEPSNYFTSLVSVITTVCVLCDNCHYYVVLLENISRVSKHEVE